MRKIFNTYKELANYYNIEYYKLLYYIKEYPNIKLKTAVERITGCDLVETELQVGYEYRGKVYTRLKDLCDDYGIDVKTFQNRKRLHPNRGMDYWLSRVTQNSGRNYTITYNGVNYASLKLLCKEKNVCYELFLKRRRLHKDESIDFWLYGKKAKQLTYGEHKYTNYTDLCRKLSVSYSAFIKRRNTHPHKDLTYWLYGLRKKGVV